MKTAGIYCIRNLLNGRSYVGSAINIKHRWHVHRSLLSRGKHHSPALQRSWLKHGEAAFSFDILEIVDTAEMLIKREQYWIDTLNVTCPRTGFNVAPKAGSSLGRKHPPEVIDLMKSQRKGRKMPPFTEAHRAALSASRLGNQWSKGAKRTAEHRLKNSVAMKGRKMPWIAESNRRRAEQRRLAISAD